jgi:large subunit ribosomal protein L25
VSVEAEATNIPAGVEVSVQDMEVGTDVHAADLDLPPGTSLITDPEALVLHVIAAPTAEQLEAEIGAPEAEAAAATEPAPVPEGEAGEAPGEPAPGE